MRAELAPADTTWGRGRYVWQIGADTSVTAAGDSIIRPDYAGLGNDTLWIGFKLSGGDYAVVTYDSLALTPEDSAWADSVATADNLCTPAATCLRDAQILNHFLLWTDTINGAERVIRKDGVNRNLNSNADTITGSDIYVWMEPDPAGVTAAIDSVHFYGENSCSDVFWDRQQQGAPYDFRGGPNETPNSWDVNAEATCIYEIETFVFERTGVESSFIRTFGVQGTTPPDSVSADSSSAISEDGAIIWGTVGPAQEDANWWGEYDTDNGFGTLVSTDTSESPAALGLQVVSKSLTSLLASTKYFFRFKAQNASGGSIVTSNIDSFTTLAASGSAPTAPSGLSATPVLSNRIDTDWTDNASDEIWQELERCTPGGCGGMARVDSIDADVTGYNDTGLSAETEYVYQVRACNATGCSSYSNRDSATTPAVSSEIPAFPGAEGFGAIALNACRGLPIVVHKVTNVNESGSGSLPNKLENQVSSSNFDIVVFTTGGTLVYTSPDGRGVFPRNVNCVYVAGQTAPGGGFQIVFDTTVAIGQSTGGAGIAMTNLADWVFRYLKIRVNMDDSTGAQGQGVAGNNIRRMVFDHLSVSLADDKIYAIDQGTGVYPISDNITISDGIMAPAGPGSAGINIHGDGDTNPDSTLGSVSIFRTYMGGNNWRFPRYNAALQGQVVNNLIWAWWSDGIRISSEWSPDLGAGCPFPGDCRRLNYEHMYNYHKPWDTNDRFGAFEWDDGDPGINGGQQGFPLWYAVGNILGGVIAANGDQTLWKCNPVRNSLCFNGTPANTLAEDSAFSATPVLSPRPTFDVDTARWTAQQTYDSLSSITGLVGASQKMQCDGTWIYNRDAVDSAFVAEVRDSSAVRGDQLSDWGPFGRAIVLDPGSACADADGDGLPKAYEDITTNLSDSDDTDFDNDPDGDGYFNIEEYVNGTDPNVSDS